MNPNNNHKAGFINIIGKPNAGKSTLINALVGENLAITSPKVQTTRHRIIGILNTNNAQIIFSDTPGIIEKTAYKLHQAMMTFVNEAFTDADIMLLLIDATDNEPFPEAYLQRIQNLNQPPEPTPLIILLNKTDLCSPDIIQNQIQKWKEIIPFAHQIIPISALQNTNTQQLIQTLETLLPTHPAYYSDEDLTDRPERFFVTEFIRQQIFLNYHQEIPYACEVIIEEYKELPHINRIRAAIIVARQSQKAIVIGKNAQEVKKVATKARLEIEKFLGKKVFLELVVKLKPNWNNDQSTLEWLGYNS